MLSFLALLPSVVDSDELENVRPGWIPLLMVLAMGAFVVFLFFSMRKQLGRIKFPEDDQDASQQKRPPAN